MDDKKIEEILNSAIEDTSYTSEKISDKVQAASAIFIAKTSNALSSQIHNLNYSLSHHFESLSRQIKTLEESLNNQVKKIIESNENLAESSNRHTNWMRVLTITLIAVTLFVGLLQAFVIWKTNQVTQKFESIQRLK